MKIIECPRDAMQGIHEFIPTRLKADYLNLLINAGFDTLDFGSFVSPRAVPQMRDTAEVLGDLDLSDSPTQLLAIVANTRGAREAAQFQQIRYLGFPLSISETFQQRNTNRSIAEAMENVAEIREICGKTNKELVVYISMGFGNPYNEPYDPEVVSDFVRELIKKGISIISLSDTIGVATPVQIQSLFSSLLPEYPEVEFGAHLHSHPAAADEKIRAVIGSGCKRLDGALRGYGGCPMAKDDLVGNIATETIVRVLDDLQIEHRVDHQAMLKALKYSVKVFGSG